MTFERNVTFIFNLSFEGFTQSYNETMQADKTTLETYLTAHPGK